MTQRGALRWIRRDSLNMEFNFSIANITSRTNLYSANERVSLILSPHITIIIVVFILLAIVIIAGNLLVLVSIRFNSRLRSPECILILSLSVADLMVGLFLLPVKIVELMSLHRARKFMWCDMTISLTLFVLSACLMNLVTVAFDRCLAISYTMRYNSFMTVPKVCFGIVMVWLTAFTVAFLPLSGVGTKSVKTQHLGRPCCFSDILEETYMGLYFAFICATPTVLITTAYLKIFLLARSQARRISSLRMYIEELSTYNGGPMNSPRPIRFARESKAAKTIGKVQKSVFYEFSFFSRKSTSFLGCISIEFRKIKPSKSPWPFRRSGNKNDGKLPNFIEVIIAR